MILIIGATGHLGREITKKCVAQGINTRCLVRETSNLNLIPAEKVEIAYGDILDVKSVSQAAEGVEAIIDVVSTSRATEEQAIEAIEVGGISNIISAAKEKGVSHILYTSVIGANPDAPVKIWKAKGKAENVLVESGIAYTIFRSSGFMSDLVEGVFPRYAASGIFTGLKHPPSFQLIAPENVAECYIRALSNNAIMNHIIYVGGPEKLTIANAVKIYSRIIGKEIKIELVDDLNIPEDWGHVIKTPNILSEDQEKELHQLLPKEEMIKFEDYLKQHLA